jgi:hypothetical protein
MPYIFTAIDTETARRAQKGEPDSNRQVPERQVSDGNGNPCRHCLRNIPEGADMLVLAHRPFPKPQPYAEVGPIFLCAETCDRHPDQAEIPDLFQDYSQILIRGYGHNDRIRYGSGQVVTIEALKPALDALFADASIAYVHMRSATNNCFQCRVDRPEAHTFNAG